MAKDDDECFIADQERNSVATSPTANCPDKSIINLSNYCHDDEVATDGTDHDYEIMITNLMIIINFH